MALFTDGEVSSIEDLRGYDTQLLDVASIEGIDVTRKLLLARDEIAAEVETMLRRVAWYRVPLDSSRVVVTPPLKLWHTYLTLEMVYRDAYRSQLNDRYAGKRDEFQEMARWAHDRVVQNGLGIANDPIGRGSSPTVQACGGALPDGTYYVAASWTNAAGEEGMPSTPATIQLAGSSFSARAAAAPANAKGWNLYAGSGPQGLTLQNASPLGLTGTWVQPDTISRGGRAAGTGQEPDYLLAVPRLIQRG